MPAVAIQFTLVRAPRGRKNHATMLSTPSLTACKKPCNGWRVASRDCLTCEGCKRAIAEIAEGRR